MNGLSTIQIPISRWLKEVRVTARHASLLLLIFMMGSIVTTASAQQSDKYVSGVVYDMNGDVIIGANVVEEGTTNGVITSVDGDYKLELTTDNPTIKVSYLGYASQSIVVGAQTVIDVKLSDSSQALEDVVVIGYGTQLRKNLSSSISKVSAEDLTVSSAPSFEAAIQGRAPGVQVTTGSSVGGSGVSIRIRGSSSFSASSEPLYVIDGIPIESGSIASTNVGSEAGSWDLQVATPTNVLASLNPNDIESLEILKDAAAAAIYGSRGANGVVLITTKRGRNNQKATISANVSFGISTATHVPQHLNSEQYIELAQEAWTNSGNDLSTFWAQSGVLKDGLTQEEAMSTDTNWSDETLRTGFTQEYNVSASGGTDKTIYYISANLKDEETILVGNHYQKFSTRLNLETQLSDVFRVGANMTFAHVNDQQVPVSWAGGVGAVTQALPIWPVYKEDGSYFNVNSNHPVATINERDINLLSNQMTGVWFLKAQIMKGLSFRSDVGVNLLVNDDYHYKSGELTWHGDDVAGTTIGRRMSYNWKNVINYNTQINKHNIDVVAAHEIQRSEHRYNSIIGQGFFNSSLTMPQDAETQTPGSSENEYSFMSVITRLNYSYDDTYLLSASFRADGSSRFTNNNKWGYFPAVSAGYTLSNEEYFEPLKRAVNMFKIRASYGVVGNAEIGNYAGYSSYSTVSYNGIAGLTPSNIADPNLSWEQTAQLDLGFNVEFLNGKIALDFDYYDKRTNDLLLPYPVSSLTGVSTITRNVGSVKNEGVEFNLNTINIDTGKFSWTTNFNVAHNENVVTSVSEDMENTESSFGGTQVHLGHPIGAKFRPIWEGVDSATGEDKYRDKSGNVLLYSEVVDQYGTLASFASEHQVATGNPYPKWTGGFYNSFRYKNWQLGVLFTFATGMDFDLGIQRRSLAAFGSTKYNPFIDVLDRWQEPGDEATVSKLTTDDVIWTETTETLHRTDYLRLKDLTLSYDFKLNGRLGIKALNCYVKGTNLLTFTKAPDSYWDPEWTASGTAYSATSADATAPQSKSIIIGVNLTL